MRSILPILAVLIISFIPFIYAQNSQPITSCNIIAIINFDPKEKWSLNEIVCPDDYKELTLLHRTKTPTNFYISQVFSIKKDTLGLVKINNRDVDQFKYLIKNQNYNEKIVKTRN